MAANDEARKNQQSDLLERELDAVLAKYAVVEPRVGLEARILARVAEEDRIPVHAWWRWSVAAVMALVLVTAALVWRSTRPSHPVAGHQAPAVETPKAPPSPLVASTSPGLATHQHAPVRKMAAQRVQATPSPAAPKLEQFPSPQPLSEQEKLLAGYVNKYPERAGLLAEARMNSLRRDEEERRQIAAGSQDSQQ